MRRRLLYPGGKAMIYSESGEGKSFIAADLSFCIAQGRDWHGHKVKQAPVLYAALEGVAGFRKLFTSLLRRARAASTG